MEASSQFDAPAALTPANTSGTNQTGGWDGPTSSMDNVEKGKKKNLAIPGIETRSLVTT
jgi:hypothetical protein